MKNSIKLSLTLILLSMSMTLLGQDKETRDLDKFYEIRVSEGIILTAEKGTKNSIEIEVLSGADIDEVLTQVRGGQLRVHMERSNYRRLRVRATLTYTEELEEIIVNTGAEGLFKSKITSDRIELSATTSGYIEANLDAGRLYMSASTSGRIDVQGSADDISAKASTGGTIYAYDVEGKDVQARANTGADVRISAEDYLSASAGTGGSVRYRGKPRTSIRTNTGGSVRSSN